MTLSTRQASWATLLLAALLIACGGDGGDDTTSSSSSGAGASSSSSSGAGGSMASGGGMTGDPCEGITPQRTVITPEQLLAMLDDKDFELINVHIPYAGEITGTDVHIAYTDYDGLEAHLGYDKGARVVLYCQTGPMSQIAGDELVSRGYCNLMDMAAGMYQWEQLGYPYTP